MGRDKIEDLKPDNPCTKAIHYEIHEFPKAQIRHRHENAYNIGFNICVPSSDRMQRFYDDVFRDIVTMKEEGAVKIRGIEKSYRTKR